MVAGGQLLKTLGHRLWQNYLMPSRLAELGNWFQRSLELGYKFYPVESYWWLTEGGASAPPAKTVLLRHDVDVDLLAAKAMFSLEKRFGIVGSYYFRLSTMDVAFMKAIAEAGGEASYHYEELAVDAKRNHLRSSVEVRNRLPEIGHLFCNNLRQARVVSGLPMLTVAAHGDWINRALGVPNTEILDSRSVRKETGVITEAYDQGLLRFVTARYTDAPNPAWWQGGRMAEGPSGERIVRQPIPATPYDAVQERLPVLYVLLHPEQWMRGPLAHFKEQTRRVSEAIVYRCRVPSGFAYRSYYKSISAA